MLRRDRAALTWTRGRSLTHSGKDLNLHTSQHNLTPPPLSHSLDSMAVTKAPNELSRTDEALSTPE